MAVALGFLETDSLISATEAANTMAKSFNIILCSKEVLSSDIVTVKIVGETEHVKAALKAAENAVNKLGRKAVIHVIDEPDEQILTILPEISTAYFHLKKTGKVNVERYVKVRVPIEQSLRMEESLSAAAVPGSTPGTAGGTPGVQPGQSGVCTDAS